MPRIHRDPGRPAILRADDRPGATFPQPDDQQPASDHAATASRTSHQTAKSVNQTSASELQVLASCCTILNLLILKVIF